MIHKGACDPIVGGYLFSSLKETPFRRLWFSVCSANTGRWSFLLALGWTVHLLTHSSFWVGASVFAVQGPILVVAPVAGVIMDHFDRRRVLAAAFGLSSLAALAMALLMASGHHSLAAVLAIALTFGTAFAVQSPTWTAMTPQSVPKPQISNAIALLGVARQGTEFSGPVLATPLLLALGPGAVFLFTALLYALSLLVVLRIPKEHRAKTASTPYTGFWSSLSDGIHYLGERPILRILIPFIGLHCVLTMAYMGVLPALVAQNLNGTAGLYGSIMTAVGLGALVGNLSLASIQNPRLLSHLFVVTMALSGLSVMVLGISSSPALALLAGFVMGASQSPFMSVTQTFMQVRLDNTFRGRVTSLRNIVTQGTMSLGNWLWGSLGLLLSPGTLLTLLGTSFLVGGGAILTMTPAMRSLIHEAVPATEHASVSG